MLKIEHTSKLDLPKCPSCGASFVKIETFPSGKKKISCIVCKKNRR